MFHENTEFTNYLRENKAEVDALESLDEGERFITLYCLYIAWALKMQGGSTSKTQSLSQAVKQLEFVLIHCAPIKTEPTWNDETIESIFKILPEAMQRSMDAICNYELRYVHAQVKFSLLLMVAGCALLLTAAGLHGFILDYGWNRFVIAAVTLMAVGYIGLLMSMCLPKDKSIEGMFKSSFEHTSVAPEVAIIKSKLSAAISPKNEHKDAVVSAVVDTFLISFYRRTQCPENIHTIKNAKIDLDLRLSVLGEKLQVIKIHY